MELSFHETQDQRGLADRGFAQQHQLELAAFALCAVRTLDLAESADAAATATVSAGDSHAHAHAAAGIR